MDILVCTPPHDQEDLGTIAKKYHQMAFLDYDVLLTFSKEYEPYKEIPDYTQSLGKNIELTVFYNQEISGIGLLEQEMISSSYLLNLKHKDLLLPFADIVEIDNTRGFDLIREFYESYGWKTNEISNTLPKKEVALTGDRFKRISLYEPETLLTIAKEYSRF